VTPFGGCAVTLNNTAFTGRALSVCTTRRNGNNSVAAPVPAVRHGSIQMNIIGRFVRVVRANLNQLAYAEVSAGLKRIERQREQAKTTSDEWKKRATMALTKGEEDLAREALTRKKAADDAYAGLEGQITTTKANVEKLFSSMQQLESKIGEARSKKDQFVARARTAKTSAKVNEMLGNVGTSGALDAFERMQSKVEELEVKADVSRDLAIGGAADTSLENKFKALESDSVEDELAKMKGQISGSSSQGALPSRPVDPEVEKEMERLKKGL